MKKIGLNFLGLLCSISILSSIYCMQDENNIFDVNGAIRQKILSLVALVTPLMKNVQDKLSIEEEHRICVWLGLVKEEIEKFRNLGKSPEDILGSLIEKDSLADILSVLIEDVLNKTNNLDLKLLVLNMQAIIHTTLSNRKQISEQINRSVPEISNSNVGNAKEVIEVEKKPERSVQIVEINKTTKTIKSKKFVPLKCDIENCDLLFSTKNKLKKHKQDHARPLYPCPSCKITYFSKQGLSLHLRVCENSTGVPSNIQVLTNKKRKVQLSTSKLVKCDIENCGLLFSNRNSLEKHKEWHTWPLYQCVLCKVNFFSKYGMQTHVNKCEGTGIIGSVSFNPQVLTSKESNTELSKNTSVQTNIEAENEAMDIGDNDIVQKIVGSECETDEDEEMSSILAREEITDINLKEKNLTDDSAILVEGGGFVDQEMGYLDLNETMDDYNRKLKESLENVRMQAPSIAVDTTVVEKKSQTIASGKKRKSEEIEEAQQG